MIDRGYCIYMNDKPRRRWVFFCSCVRVKARIPAYPRARLVTLIPQFTLNYIMNTYYIRVALPGTFTGSPVARLFHLCWLTPTPSISLLCICMVFITNRMMRWNVDHGVFRALLVENWFLKSDIECYRWQNTICHCSFGLSHWIVQKLICQKWYALLATLPMKTRRNLDFSFSQLLTTLPKSQKMTIIMKIVLVTLLALSSTAVAIIHPVET